MSKSVVHIRMSEKDNFLHEHEIYEMMRSRHLYQMQFDLRRKLEKRIRAIELAEKVHLSTFQSKKTVFLNKMREKIRQKNLKSYTTGMIFEEMKRNFQENVFPFEDKKVDTLTNNHKSSEENVKSNIRCKSLVAIPHRQHEEQPERPVTSRSVVSLNGKTFPVAKSSARSRALVTEVTIYPGDVLSQIQIANDSDNCEQKNEKNCPKTKPKKELRIKTDEGKTHNDDTLPVIKRSDAIKSLASFEMGTLTPDGHLILTREDYKDYMNNFQRKRDKRLQRVRLLSQSLDQKVQEFTIDEE